MSTWYLDASAALKMVSVELESAALGQLVDDQTPDLVSCALLETEMRRAVPRNERLTHQVVSNFLEGMDLYETPPSLFRQAGLIPGTNLRSLDALHLAAAIRIGVDHLVGYFPSREIGEYTEPLDTREPTVPITAAATPLPSEA